MELAYYGTPDGTFDDRLLDQYTDDAVEALGDYFSGCLDADDRLMGNAAARCVVAMEALMVRMETYT